MILWGSSQDAHAFMGKRQNDNRTQETFNVVQQKYPSWKNIYRQ